MRIDGHEMFVPHHQSRCVEVSHCVVCRTHDCSVGDGEMDRKCSITVPISDRLTFRFAVLCPPPYSPPQCPDRRAFPARQFPPVRTRTPPPRRRCNGFSGPDTPRFGTCRASFPPPSRLLPRPDRPWCGRSSRSPCRSWRETEMATEWTARAVIRCGRVRSMPDISRSFRRRRHRLLGR